MVSADRKLDLLHNKTGQKLQVFRDNIPVAELPLHFSMYLQRFPEITAILAQQYETDYSIFLITPEYNSTVIPLSFFRTVQSIEVAQRRFSPDLFLPGKMYQNIPFDPSKLIYYNMAPSSFRAAHAFERKNLIIMDMPYPDNLSRNYYFTREFFQVCKENLLPQGVMAVILPEVTVLGKTEKQMAEKMIQNTLETVFPYVLRLDGAHRVLLASDHENLTVDPSVLDDRATFSGLYPSDILPANLLAVTLPILAMEKREQYENDGKTQNLIDKNIGVNTVYSPVLCYYVLQQEMLYQNQKSRISNMVQCLLPLHLSLDKAGYWAGGLLILMLLYGTLRYFYPRKTIHKNIFRSFENGFFTTGILLFTFASLRTFDSGYEMGSLIFLFFVLSLFLFLFSLRVREEGSWFSPILCGVLLFMIARNGISLMFPNLLLAAAACGIMAFRYKVQIQSSCVLDLFDLFKSFSGGIVTALFVFPLFVLLPCGLWIWAGLLLLLRIVHARMESDCNPVSTELMSMRRNQ